MDYKSIYFDLFMEFMYVGSMIERAYEPLDEYLEPNKVLIIYGPRRVGKTTLLQTYLSRTRLKYKSVVGDDVPTQRLLSSRNVNLIKEYLEGYELFALDEAQYIPNIGQALKIIVDLIPGMYVFVTGSFSFELAGQVSEPLTGRKRMLKLFPFAQTELLSLHNRFELRQELEERLIFGSYPDVVTARTTKTRIEAVSEIANSYLIKDILAFERVRNSGKIWDLLKLLAFQVGSEVSHNELSRSLGVDVKTVQRYIDLLEKSFVLYRLGGFSRNLRKEVTQKAKYFFLDNGIRNAIIAQFNRLDQRDDVGRLWENFMTMERIKYLTYASEVANLYFWRTYSQQEIDLVEERGKQLDGYEYKWSPKKAVKAPQEWTNNYPGASFTVVTRENYQKIVFP